MRFHVLGPVEAVNDDGPIRIRAGKQRILLATLLLNANRVVPTDELIERLWDDPPSDARGTTQTHLQRLRRTLGTGRLIGTGPGGYVIEATPGTLDLERFNALAERARGAGEKGDLAGELRSLTEALALWRGRPLANIPSDLLQRIEVPHLLERQARAAERRFELALLLGGHADVIGELTAATRQEPFQERLWALLMTALYRSGRQAEALRCYADVSGILRAELGLDPGTELRDLHDAILNHSSGLAAPPPPPSGRTAERATWHRPPTADDLVGRAAALRRVTAHLVGRGPGADGPIVVIHGPPGVGKTALAVAAANAVRTSFPGGLFHVEAGVSRGAPPIRQHGAGPRSLLVLDGVANEDQVRSLSGGWERCGVLVTSRRRLTGLHGAVRLGLGAFSPDEARQMLERLLGDRARREPRAAAEIAELCGFQPMALRAVAGRLALRPSMPISEFVRRLRRKAGRLDELSSPDLDVRGRLDASYAALGSDARLLLRRLGTLAGSDFPESAAWMLAGDTGPRALDELVEASLVEPVGAGASGEQRYRPDSLVGLHASDLFENEPPPVREKSLGDYMDAVERVAALAHVRRGRSFGILPADEERVASALTGGANRHVPSDPVRHVLSEYSTIAHVVVEGCRRGLHERGAHLLDMVLPVLVRQGHYELLIRTCMEVARSARAAGEELRAFRADCQRAVLLARKGEMRLSAELLSGCVTAFERLGAQAELSYSMGLLSLCRSCQVPAAEPLRLAERAVRTARAAGETGAELVGLTAEAQALALLGRGKAASSLFRVALGRARELAEPEPQAAVLHRLAWSAAMAGDLPIADDHDAGLVTLAKAAGDAHGVAWAHCRQAATENAKGRHAEAIRLAAGARDAFVRLGDRRGHAWTLRVEAEARLAMGRAASRAFELLTSARFRLLELGADVEAEQVRALLTANGFIPSL